MIIHRLSTLATPLTLTLTSVPARAQTAVTEGRIHWFENVVTNAQDRAVQVMADAANVTDESWICRTRFLPNGKMVMLPPVAAPNFDPTDRHCALCYLAPYADLSPAWVAIRNSAKSICNLSP